MSSSRHHAACNGPVGSLPATVQRLSEELAGLHRARRSRTVIEQAKGVLMGRLGCSADQAFAQLMQISQHTNTKVVEVAAGLVGLTSPVLAASAQLPLPDQDAARYHLTCAAMSAARDGNEVAEALLTDGLQSLGVTGVLLGVLEPDGAMRLVGSRGVARGLVSAWQRVPGSLDVAFLKAVTDGRALWLNRAEATASGLAFLGDGEFRACLPLRRGRQVFGVAALIWAEDPGLDLTRRAYVSALAAAAGRRLTQLVFHRDGSVASPAAHWLEAVLEALPGSFALLCPVTDDTGAVVDWRFDKSSPGARDAVGRTGERLFGRRLLELYPTLANSEILRGYERALRTGRPFAYGPAELPLAPNPRAATATVSIRAARLGDGVLVTWQYDDPGRRLCDRIGRLQRAVRAGWAEWNLQSGETDWTPQTYEILGVSPPPVGVADLHRCAVSDDAPILASAVQDAIVNHQPADVTVRVHRPGGTAAVRLVVEPVLDAHGHLTAVCAAVRESPGSPTSTAAPARCGGWAGPPTSASPPHFADRGDGPPGSALAATARRLQAQVERLRRTQQTQAVVEQAKGILAVELRCSVDDAFEQLVRSSRRRRLPVVEVASEVVGVPVPALLIDSSPPEDPAFHPERYVGRPPAAVDRAEDVATPAPITADERFPRVWAAMRAAEDGDALASAVWAEGLRDLGATAVLLGVLEPDGAVRLVGTHGLPAPLVSAWRRTPSSLNVAYLRAVAVDSPLWITGEQAEEQGYQVLGEGGLRACLPLHEAGRIFGVASVLWSRPTDLDAGTRAYVAALADACGRRLSELLRSAAGGATVVSPATHWAEAVMAALPPCYALLHPVREAGDEAVDWRFECCSPETRDVAGRGPDQLVGRSVRQLYPHTESNGIADIYTAAMQTGSTVVWGPDDVDVVTPRGLITVTMSVRASRFGDGVLAHWRRHDADQRLSRRLSLLERVTDSGWADWDLAAGEAEWSPRTYEILQRDPDNGPVKLGALHRYATPEDETALAEAVQAVTRRRLTVDRAFTLRRHGLTRRVRFVAEPVLDQQGRLTAVHAVFQGLPGQR